MIHTLFTSIGTSAESRLIFGWRSQERQERRANRRGFGVNSAAGNEQSAEIKISKEDFEKEKQRLALEQRKVKLLERMKKLEDASKNNLAKTTDWKLYQEGFVHEYNLQNIAYERIISGHTVFLQQLDSLLRGYEGRVGERELIASKEVTANPLEKVAYNTWAVSVPSGQEIGLRMGTNTEYFVTARQIAAMPKGWADRTVNKFNVSIDPEDANRLIIQSDLSFEYRFRTPAKPVEAAKPQAAPSVNPSVPPAPTKEIIPPNVPPVQTPPMTPEKTPLEKLVDDTKNAGAPKSNPPEEEKKDIQPNPKKGGPRSVAELLDDVKKIDSKPEPEEPVEEKTEEKNPTETEPMSDSKRNEKLEELLQKTKDVEQTDNEGAPEDDASIQNTVPEETESEVPKDTTQTEPEIVPPADTSEPESDTPIDMPEADPTMEVPTNEGPEVPVDDTSVPEQTDTIAPEGEGDMPAQDAMQEETEQEQVESGEPTPELSPEQRQIRANLLAAEYGLIRSGLDARRDLFTEEEIEALHNYYVSPELNALPPDAQISDLITRINQYRPIHELMQVTEPYFKTEETPHWDFKASDEKEANIMLLSSALDAGKTSTEAIEKYVAGFDGVNESNKAALLQDIDAMVKGFKEAQEAQEK